MATCRECKLEFIVKPSTKGIFCSLPCYYKNMVGKPHGHKTCNGKTAWNKGRKCPELSGVNHFRWIENRSLVLKYKDSKERNSPAVKRWRKQVWLRDNFTCKIANPECAGRIEAHHILSWSEYPELRYEINNGITLCHAHHPRKRAEEKRLSPYFQELVSVSSGKFWL